MQRAKQLYDRKFDDNNTQKVVYQYYKKIYFQNLLIFGDCVQNIIIDLN